MHVKNTHTSLFNSDYMKIIFLLYSVLKPTYSRTAQNLKKINLDKLNYSVYRCFISLQMVFFYSQFFTQ